MLNALIIVWRESLEAMLVIGILLAWIARQPEEIRFRLRQGLWLGVVAGLMLAILLGYATFVVQSQFASDTLEIFQLFMLLFAALLIAQMVLWMHRHGRSMKRQIELQVERSAGPIGIGAIAALAVAREGAETVVFLYGLTMESGGTELGNLAIAATFGFILAVGTCAFVVRGARYFNYRSLFLASEILLLLIANALLSNGIDRMVGMDWLPILLDPAWDISLLLDDGRGLGHFLADFIGYRARPSGSLLVAVAIFWSLILWRLRRIDRSTPALSGN